MARPLARKRRALNCMVVEVGDFFQECVYMSGGGKVVLKNNCSVRAVENGAMLSVDLSRCSNFLI